MIQISKSIMCHVCRMYRGARVQAWIIHEIKIIQILGVGSCRNNGLFQGFRNVGDG